MIQKKLWRNFAITPVLSIYLFPYQNFSENPNSSQLKFSLMWDQNFPTEKRDILLASKKCFCCQKLREKTKWTQWKFSVMWDEKIWRKTVIFPSLIQRNFSLSEFPWNPEEFPMIFSVIWDQSFHRNLRYPPSCPFNSSHTRNFLKPRIVPNETFRYCNWKIFPRENVIPLLASIKSFRYQKLSGTTKCSQ